MMQLICKAECIHRYGQWCQKRQVSINEKGKCEDKEKLPFKQRMLIKIALPHWLSKKILGGGL